MSYGYSVSLMIADSGEKVKLQRVNAESEGADGSVSTDVVSEVLACSSPAPVSARIAAGGNYEIGDFRIVVSAEDPRMKFSPRSGDVAWFDGESYQVVGVNQVREFGSTVAFALTLRGTS